MKRDDIIRLIKKNNEIFFSRETMKYFKNKATDIKFITKLKEVHTNNGDHIAVYTYSDIDYRLQFKGRL